MSKDGVYPAGVSGNEREITGSTDGLLECGCGAFCYTLEHVCGVDLCEDCAKSVKDMRLELAQYGLEICEVSS